MDPGDPEAWRSFKPNPLTYAWLWLETGELPDSCHFVIRERLAPWIAAVLAGGEALRAQLLAVIPPIEPRPPEPTRAWIMPGAGKGLPVEMVPADPAFSKPLEIHFGDLQECSTFSGSDVEIPLGAANDTVALDFEGVGAREPSVSPVLTFCASAPGDVQPEEPGAEPAEFPPGFEMLTDPTEIRKRRRGYPSVFKAEFWGEPEKPPPYPSYPTGKVSGITLAEYRAKLLPAIKARSAPALLPANVALVALRIDKDVPASFNPRQRPAWWPKWLPVDWQDGEWWVERDELREHLFPEEYLGPRPASPIVVPRCRYCGRLSHHGWSDQICDRCEAIRTQIETAQMARFSIADRRGWTGPALISDDELLLVIQRRLASADRTASENARKEERKAAREARRRSSETRGAEPDEIEEPDLDEPAVDLAEAA